MSQHLIDIKQALAEKYAQKARTTTSDPLRKRMMHRAKRYRAQVKKIQSLMAAGVKPAKP